MNEQNQVPEYSGDDDDDTELDVYRAGYLAGVAAREPEIEHLEGLADLYYRVAFSDERRVPTEHVSHAELERRRQIADPPPEVTRAQALASWGIEDDVTAVPAIDRSAADVRGQGRNGKGGRRMTTRTVVGNLAADPEAIQVGRVRIVKLRVLENTGEYRKGEWVEHDAPTTHFVDARFELGQNVLETLHRGDAVVVVGYEHTTSWEQDGQRRYGRVIDADAIGPNLARATAQLTRNSPPVKAR